MDDYSEKQFEVRKKLLLIFISVLAFLIFAYLSGELPWVTESLLFVQLISSIFAIFIGLLSLVRFYTKKNRLSFLVLGLGFLFVGLLEGIQIISSVGVFQNLLGYNASEFFPLSMVLSKSFLAVIFFLAYLVRKDYDNPNNKEEKFISLGVVTFFVILISIFLFFTDALSDYQEYAPAVIGGILSMVMFTFSIFGHLRGPGWKYDTFEYWQIFSIVFLLISTIFFLPFLNLEYDLMILFSVLATFFSYVLLLIGFLVSIYEMYSRESEYLQELRKKNELLLKSKNRVEDAYMILREEKWKIAKGRGGDRVEGILDDVMGGGDED